MRVYRRRQFLRNGLFVAAGGLLTISGFTLYRVRLPARIPRVVMVMPGSDMQVGVLLNQSLRERGYTVGQDLFIDIVGPVEGGGNQLDEAVAEAVRREPDVILSWSSRATKLLKDATQTIPIVMVTSGDPVGLGLIQSLARPGGNVTGVSASSAQLAPKRLQLLMDAAPHVSHVAVIWNPADPDHQVELAQIKKAAAQVAGLQILDLPVRGDEDYPSAAQAIAQSHVDALIGLAGPFSRNERLNLLNLAQKTRLPSMFEWRYFVDGSDGGLVSYGPNLPDLFRRVGIYVEKLLKGAKPADLPVEQPTVFDFVINQTTAHTLGLTIPASVLQQATAIVQPAVAQVGIGSNPMPFKAPTVAVSAPTTLTLWHNASPQIDVQKEIAAEYRQQGDPNVSLEISVYSGNAYLTAIKRAIADESPTPDILGVDAGADTVEYVTKGSIIPMNTFFDRNPDFKASFWPSALELLTINGHTAGAPVATDCVVVYYNKTMFAQNGVQVPETWEEMKRLATIFNSQNIAPMAVAAGHGRQSPITAFYSVAGGLKLDAKMREADLGQLAWTSSEMMRVAEKTEEIIRSDVMIKGAATLRTNHAIPRFLGGNAAMLWANQNVRNQLRDAMPAGFDLGLFAFPSVVAGGPKLVVSTVSMALAVNAKSKHQDRAFEMIRALTGERGKVSYAARLALSPNGPINAESRQFQMSLQQEEPFYHDFLELQPTGTTSVIYTTDVLDALSKGWLEVWAGTKTGRQVMEDVEAASQKAGPRTFTVG